MPTEHQSGSLKVGEKFRWQINIRLLSFGALFMPLLLGLCFWQWDRGTEKADLLAELEARMAAPAVNITDLDAVAVASLPSYSQIILRGTADNARVMLLDNKTFAGRVGYQVVQLVQTPKANVLINRGWIAGPATRAQKPAIAPLRPNQRFTGRLTPVNAHPMLNSKSDDALYPKRYNQLLLADASQQLGVDIAHMVELSPESYGALSVNWASINVSPAKHYGYAVQWLCMSVALLVLLIFANSNLAQLIGPTQHNNQESP
jgi:surfeit locus 1 family protein